ncbi:hypothetical protein [Aquibacillus sediminis]|uniref:hypothetical protein n=1 Tax=Aquibacillus sediminis TaxID=2574734 RepID=UPI001107F870|nr:hypothetical protein [Aquibacillus sediminis]
MISWNFPSNNHGTETGLNDAGIETFKGRPLVSLTREIIQNSSDAKIKDSNKPVIVRFNLEYFDKDDFPKSNEFIDSLQKCKAYWSHNDKAVMFFENALKVMNEKKIPFLKISDYNTTGLTGSSNERRRGSNWFNLILTVGSSDKGATSGGSFGIGKNAPFACSDLRTVFYGTRDIENKTAFQGVSKLVTHVNDENETTQGTGFYGSVDKNLPITNENNIQSAFHREEQGTDVFIAGFPNKDGWQDIIIKSVLEDFFVAIHRGNLIVEVENTIINSNNLHDLFEKHLATEKDNYSYKYYSTMLTNPPIIGQFKDSKGQDMGEVELYIKSKKDFPKKVAMVRNTGMKIFDKGHFRTPLKFAGVFIAKGDKLNQFLRSVENPAHDKWEKDRHENPSYAQKTLTSINKWINEQVKGLSKELEVDEIEVEGMSQFLPDETDDMPLNDDTKNNEGEKRIPNKKVELETVSRKPSPTPKTKPGQETNTSNNGAEDGLENAPGESENTETGGSPSSKSTETGNGTNLGGKEGKNEGQRSPSPTPTSLKHKRIFCINPKNGVYRASLKSDKDGKGFLKFQIIGEDGKEDAVIASVNDVETGEMIEVSPKGKVGPVNFTNNKLALNVTLQETVRCALEVVLYEN